MRRKQIIFEALLNIATLKTSLGCTITEFTLPIETTEIFTGCFFVSKHATTNFSLSLSIKKFLLACKHRKDYLLF